MFRKITKEKMKKFLLKFKSNMPYKERLRMMMHAMFCGIIIIIANLLYHYDTPTTVFTGIIYWLYWKELRDNKKFKELKSFQNNNLSKIE